MSKLKPCPFCGATAKVEVDHVETDYWGYWQVGCFNVDCPVRPVTDGYDTEAEALSAWNNRAEVKGDA